MVSVYWTNKFNELNREYFEGKLTPINVYIKTLRANSGEYYLEDEEGPACIYLDDALRNERKLNILLHEMCHHAAFSESPNEIHHHGKTWKKYMRQCGFTGKITKDTGLFR